KPTALGRRQRLENPLDLVAIACGLRDDIRATAAPLRDPAASHATAACRQRHDWAVERGSARSPSESSRALFLAKSVPLLAVEERSEPRQAVINHLEQLALARLTKDVTPVVAIGPELGVPEGNEDAPDHRHDEEVPLTHERGDYDHSIDEEIGRE